MVGRLIIIILKDLVLCCLVACTLREVDCLLVN